MPDDFPGAHTDAGITLFVEQTHGRGAGGCLAPIAVFWLFVAANVGVALLAGVFTALLPLITGASLLAVLACIIGVQMESQASNGSTLFHLTPHALHIGEHIVPLDALEEAVRADDRIEITATSAFFGESHHLSLECTDEAAPHVDWLFSQIDAYRAGSPPEPSRALPPTFPGKWTPDWIRFATHNIRYGRRDLTTAGMAVVFIGGLVVATRLFLAAPVIPDDPAVLMMASLGIVAMFTLFIAMFTPGETAFELTAQTLRVGPHTVPIALLRDARRIDDRFVIEATEPVFAGETTLELPCPERDAASIELLLAQLRDRIAAVEPGAPIPDGLRDLQRATAESGRH